ncbi:MAG: carboxypeptidase regulatory-like domain-containing protein [Nitrospirae bacterium]|nr:carboxypeptidase regulatory-like domain-containing protein [Nitrospirota bacterium]
MRFLISFIIVLLLNASCAGTANTAKNIEDGDNDMQISIFDGSALKNIKGSKHKFVAEHNISSDYYGVIFITKKGFYPKAVLFKSTGRPVEMDKPDLKRLKETNVGILTGVVYKAVTGGKIREHNGIITTFKDELVTFMKDFFPHTAVTDENGIFMILLDAGEYNIVFGSKETGKITIEPGKTVIKNIQKGLRLID